RRSPPTGSSTASRCGAPMAGNLSGPPTVMATRPVRRISLLRTGWTEGQGQGRIKQGARGMKSFGKWLWDWAKSIAVALVVWFFLRTFLVEAFRIPSGSMENTLLIGDFLFVNKLLYGAEVPLIHKRLPAVREPRRDDVVVCDSVEEGGLKVVKRLVGMPGDTLAMKSGQLWRNGSSVDEPWARHGNPSAFADA